jgi:predicted amidohydrolase YtcJ
MVAWAIKSPGRPVVVARAIKPPVRPDRAEPVDRVIGRTVVVRRAEVDGAQLDVVWRDGAVSAVAGSGCASVPGAIEIDAGGGALVPGLHDHHIHLLALAAARASVRVGPPEVVDVRGLSAVLAAAGTTARSGWVRAVGYHESVAGDLDAATLDRLVPAGRDVAIRVQHRSGQLWVLNARAIAVTGLDRLDRPGIERDAAGAVTGRVFGLDDLLREMVPTETPDLAALGRELASYGVTGVTDLTPTESSSEVEVLAHGVTAAGFPVGVVVTGGPGLDPATAPGLARGPVKFLPADHAMPDVDALIAGFVASHAAGRPVAVHCVTRVGLVIALAAWRDAGVMPGDRIEHGAVVPDDLLDELRDLGLVVVTQPNFVAERGDAYLADVEPADQPHLWRCGSLASHGIGVAAGTDAPFGHPDPWRAITAAVERRTSTRAPLGRDEAVGPAAALDLFLGAPDTPHRPRRIAAGTITDLCLLDRPLADALAAPTADAVRATIGRAGLTVVR